MALVKDKPDKNKKIKKIDAIILAGGSVGFKQLFPRALIEIDGETLLQKQIKLLEPFAKNIIVACTEKEAQQIKSYYPKLKVIFATTKELIGSAGALKRAINFVKTDEFLVVNVDDITDVDIASLINFGSNTVCVSNPRLPYGVVEIENQTIRSFREKPLLKELWVNCGVYLLNKNIAHKLPQKGSLAKDVLPYIELKAYKHFGSWFPVRKTFFSY